MSGRVRPGLAAALAAGALLLSACGQAQDSASPAAASSATAATESASASAPTAPEPSASATASPSGFDRTAVPATTSGPLGASTMPRATALGPGWKAYVDNGSPEEGYTGNGTPVVARDPRDVTDAMLPFGCQEATYATPVPVPVHALEADYRHTSGRHAVGIALDYGTPEAAQRFVDVYTAAMRACVAGGGATTVVTVTPVAVPGAFADVQRDTTDGTVYRELVVPAGRVVRLLDVEGEHTPLAPWTEIAAAFPPAPA
ncbi:MAG: hypothetical protein GC157_15415 [Frankiales bacterium]|nr:hypothetical protein [Frankiales bacterium]